MKCFYWLLLPVGKSFPFPTCESYPKAKRLCLSLSWKACWKDAHSVNYYNIDSFLKQMQTGAGTIKKKLSLKLRCLKLTSLPVTPLTVVGAPPSGTRAELHDPRSLSPVIEESRFISLNNHNVKQLPPVLPHNVGHPSVTRTDKRSQSQQISVWHLGDWVVKGTDKLNLARILNTILHHTAALI